MDGHGIGNVNMRNWSFLDSANAPKGHLGLQLMSSVVDEKPFMQQPQQNHQQHHQQQHQQQPMHHTGHNGYPALMAMSANAGLFHQHLVGGITGADYLNNMRDNLFSSSKDRNLNLLSNNIHHHHHANYGVFAESSNGHSVQMLLSGGVKNESEPLHHQLQLPCPERDVDVGVVKKRGGPKLQADKPDRVKKAKRGPKGEKDEYAVAVPRIRAPKKSVELVINGVSMDISGIPIPVCTCTGSPQQCYRWGSGGWQSACCTTLISMYPLPMNSKRRGARIAGRKMSVGAFKKVLEKLASEGFSFSNPIDLRNYWAKHGTNKFVTIR